MTRVRVDVGAPRGAARARPHEYFSTKTRSASPSSSESDRAGGGGGGGGGGRGGGGSSSSVWRKGDAIAEKRDGVNSSSSSSSSSDGGATRKKMRKKKKELSAAETTAKALRTMVNVKNREANARLRQEREEEAARIAKEEAARIAKRKLKRAIRANMEILAARNIDEILTAVARHSNKVKNHLNVVNIATAIRQLARHTPPTKTKKVISELTFFVGDKRFESLLLGLVMRLHPKMEPFQLLEAMKHLAQISAKCGYSFQPELWRRLDDSVRQAAPFMAPLESAQTLWAYGRLFDLGSDHTAYLAPETFTELVEVSRKHAADGLVSRYHLCGALWSYLRILEQLEGWTTTESSDTGGINRGDEGKNGDAHHPHPNRFDFGPIDKDFVFTLSEAMMLTPNTSVEKINDGAAGDEKAVHGRDENKQLTTWMLGTVMRSYARLYDAGEMRTLSDEMAEALMAASESLAPKMATWHIELVRSVFFRFGLESRMSPGLSEALDERLRLIRLAKQNKISREETTTTDS